MPKFKKKPIIIEAEQFFPDKKPWPCGVVEYTEVAEESLNGTRNEWKAWRVHTIHNGQSVKVEPGDWIIPEPDGEHFYPCKPDIFKATYDSVGPVYKGEAK